MLKTKSILKSVVVLVSLCFLCQAELVRAQATTEATHAEVLHKWSLLESKIGSEVPKLLNKYIEPYLDKITSQLNISKPCSQSLLRFYQGIKVVKPWAMKLLDSSGKPMSGLMHNPTTFGSYTGCLDSRIPKLEEEMKNKTTLMDYFQVHGNVDFVGKYCFVDVRLPLPKREKFVYTFNLPHPFENYTTKNEWIQFLIRKVGYLYEIPIRTGVCLPSKCTDGDIKNIVQTVAQKTTVLDIQLYSCEIKSSYQLEVYQIAILCVFGLFLGVCCLATFLDYHIYGSGPKMKDCVFNSDSQFLTASTFAFVFSMRQNARLVFGYKPHNDTRLSSLQGMRFLAFSWVLLCHTVVIASPFLFRNPEHLREMYTSLWTQVFANFWLPVDVFFFISGTLMSYLVVTGVDSKRQALNIPKMILKRIWRLLPGELVVTGFMFLLPGLNTAPFWKEFFDPAISTCKRSWWYIFTFGQNFANPNDTCLIHLWYVSVDMQYFVIGLIYLIILFRNKIVANIFLASCLAVSIGLSTYLNYVKEMPPVIFPMYNNAPAMLEFAFYNHFLPHAHLCVYVIGLGTGTFLARTEKLNYSKIKRTILWIYHIIIGLFSCYGSYLGVHGHPPSTIEGLVYTALHHIGWAFVLNWLVTMCATGHSRFLNWVLSWKVFQFLSRPSYMMFLFHYLVLTYYFKSMQGEQDFNLNILIFLHCGNLIATYIGAVTLSIVFDTPLQKLGSMLLNRVFKDRLPELKIESSTPPVGEVNLAFSMNQLNSQKSLEK